MYINPYRKESKSYGIKLVKLEPKNHKNYPKDIEK